MILPRKRWVIEGAKATDEWHIVHDGGWLHGAAAACGFEPLRHRWASSVAINVGPEVLRKNRAGLVCDTCLVDWLADDGR